LKEFLDDSEAAYKTEEQALLVKAILLKVPYILAVLPINSGKSLSYLLTSSLSTSKVTLVILPLVALKKDIKRRSLEFNIPIS
jgi:superfamily II DNA helicase RecQ